MNTEHTSGADTEHAIADDLRDTPACPNCGKPMRFVRSVPRLAALPELRTYGCKACGVSYTAAVESGDGVTWIED